MHGLTTSQEQRPSATPPPVAAGKARLELRATRGNSYLLVRKGSVLGELAYEGTLERGQKKFFDGQVLWVRLESPQNVRRAPQRQPRPAAGRRQGAGRLRDGEEDLRGRRGLTGANGARPRAVIVVTGSELVRGERTDLNGPFLARALLALGVEPTRIHVVGDDPDELEAAVAEAVAAADLVATSGGLGPTHDDRTVAIVAKVAGLGLRVDAELEAQIEGVSRMVAERMKRPYADFSEGVTKQATVPEPVHDPRSRRHRAGARRRGERHAGDHPSRPAAGAAAALAEGARDGRRPPRARARHAAAPPHAALLRPGRVAGRAGLPGGRGRRRRARGDHLRAQLRDPRRPPRGAERRAAAARARGRARRSASAGSSSRPTGAASRRSSSTAAVSAAGRWRPRSRARAGSSPPG